MPSWEFPFDVTVQHYSTPFNDLWKVSELPTPTSTETLTCDIQPKTPGSILQATGIECNGGCFVFADKTEKSKIRVGSTFVYEGQTYVFKSIPASRVEGSDIDHIKAVAVALDSDA